MMREQVHGAMIQGHIRAVKGGDDGKNLSILSGVKGSFSGRVR